MSRSQIVDAAVRVVRAGGYEQMTIRGLAAELGVSPMALYNHVEDKDDLMVEVVDRLLARLWKPRSDPAEWREWVAEAADKLRRFLVSQPAALHVYLMHPVTSPTAVARMDAVIAVLRRALGDEEAAQWAYATVHTYTLGFAALEASRAKSGDQLRVESATGGEPRSDPEDAAMIERLASYTSPEQFKRGLDYLLDGIAKETRIR